MGLSFRSQGMPRKPAAPGFLGSRTPQRSLAQCCIKSFPVSVPLRSWGRTTRLQGLSAPIRDGANRSQTNGLKAATHETKGRVCGQDSVIQPHAPLSALTHGPWDTRLSCPPHLSLPCPGRLRVMGKGQATCYLPHYWPAHPWTGDITAKSSR